jgi:sorbitol-specific phosphotransferase system component IIC
MSGIITLVIALILLVAAVYNLISYIRDRRSASLPSKNQTLNTVKTNSSLLQRWHPPLPGLLWT